ncbi:MAG: hypothetical protein IPP52_16895 [Ignavibacteria bacterium]|nr:hypothetical protein [Ignavibacteria bacterium]
MAAKDTILSKKSVFVINGRRVVEISKVDQFRTKTNYQSVFIKFPVDEFHSDGVIKSLTLKIDNSNEPDKSIDGHKLRSVFLDGAIIIFQKHDEFQKRLHHSSKGYFEINDKLIHYIALEIITHLQKMTFKTTGERNEMIFENFVSLILEFEDELKNFTGKKFKKIR